jgi:hypothetical protein
MATTSIELKRYCKRLSPERTDEVVGAVVELIVNFLKRNEGSTGETAGNRGTTRNKHRKHEQERSHGKEQQSYEGSRSH